MPTPQLLLVDSDARSLRVLEVSLQNAGYLVATATDGQDALDKIGASPPDLVISNSALQGIDGFELCHRLKGDGALARIPFVFLTTQASDEERARGFALGAADWLVKPIFIKEVVARVRLVLEWQQKAETDQELRRLEERGRLLEHLPPLASVFELDYTALGAKIMEIPEPVAGMLRLFDGRRTLAELVAAAPLDELDGLDTVRGLYQEGLLRQVIPAPASSAPSEAAAAELAQWAAASPEGSTPGAESTEAAPAAESAPPAGAAGAPEGGAPAEPPPAEREAEPAPAAGAPAPPEAAAPVEPPPEAAVEAPAPAEASEARVLQAVVPDVASEAPASRPAHGRGGPIKIVHFNAESSGEPGGNGAAHAAHEESFFAGTGPHSLPPPVAEDLELTPVSVQPTPRSWRIPALLGVLGVVLILDIWGFWGLWSQKPAPSADLAPAPTARPITALSPVPEATPPEAPSAAAAAPNVAAGAPNPEPAAPAPAPVPSAAPAVQPTPPAAPAVDTDAVFARALSAGEAKYRAGALKEAIVEYKKAVAAKPENDTALAALGSALYEDRKTSAALRLLERALAVNPKNARACLALGTLYQEQGNTAEAVSMYRRYLASDPHGQFAEDVKTILKTLK